MVPGRVDSITSRHNPKFKRLRALARGKGSERFFLIEGMKLIEQAQRAGLVPDSVWTTGATLDQIQGTLVPHYHVSQDMYRQCSPTRSGQPPLAIFPKPSLGAPSEQPHGALVLLDQIQDPGNAGALIRAAAAFGVSAILWRQPCASPYHHACIRGSAGSVFHLPHYLLDQQGLDSLKGPFIGADSHHGTPLSAFDWPNNFILALGNEGHGLGPEILNRTASRIRISTQDKVESLNVNGAAHILLHHYYQTRD